MGSDLTGFEWTHNMTLHCKDDLAVLSYVDCRCRGREKAMERSACSLLQ